MSQQHASSDYLPRISSHAWARMGGRGLNCRIINAVLSYGRVVHVRGAAIHVIGKKEVLELSRQGVDVDDCEGVQVVCTPDCETVITVYRNSNFRGLRPRSKHRWH
jgi:hypothetical protein